MKKKIRVRSTYEQKDTNRHIVEEAAAAYGVRCTLVSVRDAKNQLSSLLDRAATGEQIVVTSDGRPKAMIVRFKPIAPSSKWISRAKIRELSTCEDSTPLIRAERDRGY